MLKLPKAAAVALQTTLWVTLSSPWATLADAAPANTATQSQTTPRIHKGDLVQLSSGGPVVTVKSVSDNWVICTWFDDYGELQSTAFQIAMIAGPLSPDNAKPQTNGQMSHSSPSATLADAAPANTATQSETTPLLHEGDLVRLRSGGPAMTVKRVWENWVICNWNGGYGAQSAAFPIVMIAGPLTLSADEANPQTSPTEPSVRPSGDSSNSGQTNQNPTAQGTNQTRQVRPANEGTSMSPSTKSARVFPMQQGTGSIGPAPVLPRGTVQTVIPLQRGNGSGGPALLLPQGKVQTVIPFQRGGRVGPALVLPQGTVQTVIPLQHGTGTHPTIPPRSARIRKGR